MKLLEQRIRQFPDNPAKVSDAEALSVFFERIRRQRTHQVPAAEALLGAEVRPTVESPVLLGTLLDRRLQVLEPFRVEFRREEDQIVAGVAGIDEFGFGSSSSEALHDLQRALASLYYELEANRESLGRDLEQVWIQLNKKVARIEP